MAARTARPASMALMALATLGPLLLFAAGLSWGGVWAYAGLVHMALLVAVLDQFDPHADRIPAAAADPAAGTALLCLLALGTLVLLPVGVLRIAGPGPLSVGPRVALFLAIGLWLGQVANTAAHELIHRTDRRLFRLGALVYAVLLFGHHVSAHRLVHHRHAASAADPNTARMGEGFYRFALRAWLGSFRAGWQAEARRQPRLHPYTAYVGLGLACLALAWGLAGWPGLLVWLGLAGHAQGQLLLSDYVQHYGLMRRPLPDGRLEPVLPRHSWNAPHWLSSAMMLQAPRHSDHHAHPARPYTALRLPPAADAPRLPWPLPVACVIALMPPLWRRAIRPHLAPWRAVAP